MSISEDPLLNAVYGGIKEDIKLLLGADRFRGALLLIYAGIDCMASIGMPATQDDVKQVDFVLWADTYIRFPGTDQVTGVELYAARCALLHQYGTSSRINREGRGRQLGYGDDMNPPVRFDKAISSDLVIVSVRALADAFFQGIDRFVVDVFKDPKRARITEQRLNDLILALKPPG
jgi:hypothetical protein